MIKNLSPATFIRLFQERRHEDELMDHPTTSRKDFTEALYDIQWVNCHLGGVHVLLEALSDFLPAQRQERPMTILDLGTGSADIPRAIVKWARQQSIAGRPLEVKITAVDIHPVAVELARQFGMEYPDIQVVKGDALALDYADETFDVVISSMFMHHLENNQAVLLLQEMARLCRQGLILNDLERHPLAWLGIKTLGFLQGRGKIFQNDAPLSVLRGFTRQELIVLKDAAGLPDMSIQHRKPYRWVLTWKKLQSRLIPQHGLLEDISDN